MSSHYYYDFFLSFFFFFSKLLSICMNYCSNWCSYDYSAKLWSSSSSNHSSGDVKASTEYSIYPRLFKKKTLTEACEREEYKPFYLQLPGAHRCRPLQMFFGTIDGLFISFSVVTLKGWIAFLQKGMDYGVLTHAVKMQAALQRTHWTAAEGKGPAITPTVTIISIRVLCHSLNPVLICSQIDIDNRKWIYSCGFNTFKQLQSTYSWYRIYSTKWILFCRKLFVCPNFNLFQLSNAYLSNARSVGQMQPALSILSLKSSCLK